MTVMLLAHENVTSREKFSEDGTRRRAAAGGQGQRRGAGARRRRVDAGDADAMVSAVRWAR